MLRYRGQAVVQFPDAHHVSVVHLVEKPEHAVAFDRLLGGKLTEGTVTAQQDPGADLREGQGEAIGKRKGRHSLPVGQGKVHTVAIQVFDDEAKSC